MKSTLPAMHLFRHFLLFTLTAVFLLTVMRSAYGLWQFPKVDASGAVVGLFTQGLRFDLALIGQILIIPVVIGSLLAVTDATRGLAKFVITLFLVGGLLLILLLELVTPWFVETQGVRPDVAMLSALPEPIKTFQQIISQNVISVVIYAVLCALIIIAFWSRMEMRRFLRYRVSVPSGLTLAVLGGLACLVAIWSSPDIGQGALSPSDAQISQDATVNDLVMNSAYKSIYGFIVER